MAKILSGEMLLIDTAIEEIYCPQCSNNIDTEYYSLPYEILT
jgi:hypothetical protein